MSWSWLSSRWVFVEACLTVEGASESDKLLVFGSGTKLLVSGQRVQEPRVRVYPVASGAELHRRNLLLCVAYAMSPPLVRFSWKRWKEDGPLEELPPGQGEQLELTADGSIVAIRYVEQDPQYTFKYRCHVEHESKAVDALQDQEVFAAAPPSCASPASPVSPVSSGEQDTWRSKRQICLMYLLLIAKSLVYCCGVCLLRACTRKSQQVNE